MFTYATKPQERRTAAAGKTNTVRLSRQSRNPRAAAEKEWTRSSTPAWGKALVAPKVQTAPIQAAGDSNERPLEAGVEARIQSLRGTGEPLPEHVQDRMEAALGADFSGVRVHTVGASSELNRALRAQAFTVGTDIFFDAGKYSPQTVVGQGLPVPARAVPR